MTQRLTLWAGALLALLLALPAAAQDDDDKENSAIYIPMSPPFVVNYGGQGRLKYLKTELSLRVEDVQTASAVRHHMPLLRNAMVMLFSRQTEEAITTQEGVAQLRETAKEEMVELLKSENSPARIINVYFNNLVVQK